jgi:hypothetical protein
MPSSSHRPGHERAIHSSLDRSRADNHGQRQGALDLRGSLPSEVTIPLDLALGAGGCSRAFDASIYLQVAPFQSRSVVPADLCNEI